MKSETLCRTAAALAFAAVALGAFGAHALRARLDTTGYAEVWRTAVFYHLTHAIALFALALFQQSGGRGKAPRVVTWLMLLGIFVFSGSLYALALTGVRWLGAITPLGGLCLLAAWGWLVVRGINGESAEP